MEAIVCSQFPEVAALAEAAETAASTGLGAEAAQQALDLAVTSHEALINPMTGSAILFALIGFCLVTGIELAGKKINAKAKA